MTLIALSDSQRLAGAGQDSARSKSDASAEVVVRFRDASTFSSGYESLYKRWESFVRGSLGGDEGPGGPCGHLCSDLVFLVDHLYQSGPGRNSLSVAGLINGRQALTMPSVGSRTLQTVNIAEL